MWNTYEVFDIRGIDSSDDGKTLDEEERIHVISFISNMKATDYYSDFKNLSEYEFPPNLNIRV